MFAQLPQLLAGMWEARRGKIFGAVVFSSYGAFWIRCVLLSCWMGSTHPIRQYSLCTPMVHMPVTKQ